MLNGCQNFCLYYQNTSGLRTKIEKLFVKSSALDYNIIVFTETWLTENHNNLELFDCKLYNVFRKDRCPVKTRLGRGGGILVAVQNNLHVKKLELHFNLLNIDIDQLILKISFTKTFEILLIVSYIPPNSPLSVYETHIKNCNFYLENLLDYQHVIYMGDFNLGQICWNLDKNLLPFQIKNDFDSLLLEFLSLNNLYQINNILNENFRILDLVMVDNDFNHNIFEPILPIFDKTFHHAPITVEFSVQNFQPLGNSCNFSYDFKNADYQSINLYLCDIDWLNVLSRLELKEMYCTFLSTFLEAINLFVPKKPLIVSSKPPWYNKRLSNLKNKKNKSFKRLRSDVNNHLLKNNYIKLQKDFDVLNSFLYKSYIISTESSIKNNSKVFWQFINSKRKSNGLPTFMHYLDDGSADPEIICDLFATYFKSVYSEPTTLVPDFPNLSSLFNLSDLHLTISDIEDGLENLNAKTSLDSDGICNLFLVNCSKFVSLPLFIIFNMSLSTGTFLDHWKISQVVPIFKSGNKQDICNYRPISKIPCIPKLFEKLITLQISPFINKSLSDSQHGFRAGRSTATNLVLFTNYVFNNFSNRQQTDVIYTDFAKAFDKVDHKTLLHKLDVLGFKSNLLLWLSSYLKNRYQVVNINGAVSNKFEVTSGVPQGSHLGPLLFLLFINDLPSVIKFSHCLLFADDLKIFRHVSHLNDCLLIQLDLNAVSGWCKNNNLLLNINKCHSFTFFRTSSSFEFGYSIDSIYLVKVSTIKDLGILFDPKLTFDSHVNLIISKSLSMLGFLKRNTLEFSNIDCILTLYNALVRPNLEYCCIVWNPTYSSHSLRIEKVQSNFTRYLFYKLGWQIERPNYTVRCALFGITMLDIRRKMYSIIFIRDLVQNHINCPDLLKKLCFYAPLRPLRENFHFVSRFSRSQFTESETIQHCCKHVNSILNKIDIFQECTRNTFKKNLVLILNQNN